MRVMGLGAWRGGRSLGFFHRSMFCGRLRWRRRFSRTRRLRLRNTTAGKSNNNDESKNLCNHSANVRRRSDSSQSNSGASGSGCGPKHNFSPGLSEPVVCATLCTVDLTLGCLKWAAVGFVVAFALMKLFEASQIHDDIPKPAFKIRQTKRATIVLSTFAAVLSGLVWLLVQKLD